MGVRGSGGGRESNEEGWGGREWRGWGVEGVGRGWGVGSVMRRGGEWSVRYTVVQKLLQCFVVERVLVCLCEILRGVSYPLW